jgi:hypothetical protein
MTRTLEPKSLELDRRKRASGTWNRNYQHDPQSDREAVARHCGARPADDDRTVMILRFDNFRHGYNQNAVPVLEEATV